MKNIIFNCNKFTDSDREIIYDIIDFNLDDHDYELYEFDKKEDYWKYGSFNSSLSVLIKDNDVEEYVLIESLNDFYKLVNKEIIYELW